MSAPETWSKIARRFRDDATAIDRAATLPIEHLDALAAEGLYGAFAPRASGGLDLSLPELCGVVEELAAACLASTFVWIQHFRLLAAALDPNAPASFLERREAIIRGATKGGVALGGQLPGSARLRATAHATGWTLEGEAPWVSGWGLVDALFVSARTVNETVVNVVLDATEQPGLKVTRRQLAALNASATVTLHFESLAVKGDQVLGEVTYAPDNERPEGLRVNGSLALGVVRRCCTLLGPTPLDVELAACREALDLADVTTMADARAGACALAVRAAHALSVQRGSSSVLVGDVSERTSREAALLLTFASRPSIRAALLDIFGVGPSS